MFWLRTNNTQKVIAALFSIEQQDVSRYCEQVRIAMEKDFVPLYLCANHMNREKWLDCNTQISKELFFSKEMNGFKYFIKT